MEESFKDALKNDKITNESSISKIQTIITSANNNPENLPVTSKKGRFTVKQV